MQSLLAIADPTRRKIVELLAVRERTSGELVAAFDLSAPAISQHLNILRDAGLIALGVFAGCPPPSADHLWVVHLPRCDPARPRFVTYLPIKRSDVSVHFPCVT